jgi:predicted dehydrogenase
MAKKNAAYNDMSSTAVKQVAAPELPYQPPRPKKYNPPIAIIGCGGISGSHLPAYKAAGFNVVACCHLIESRAKERRDAFFPNARVYTGYRELLKRDDIEVIDIATHPQDREYLIPACLKAHKHVLSQKPFVLDLDKGYKFSELADKMGVKLATTQNGRWSPHWSYIRNAIQKGLIGEVGSVHLECYWNHEWIANAPFNRVHHIMLYDYGIHWYDAVSTFLHDRTAKRAFSTLGYAKDQRSKPPLIAQSLIEFDEGSASIAFNGKNHFNGTDEGYVIGSKGTLRYKGAGLEGQTVELTTKRGHAVPKLEGRWFVQGFQGSMGELLRAIEKKDTPLNNPDSNLRGLAICFAAVVSAESGKPEIVGKVRRAPLKTCMVAPG